MRARASPSRIVVVARARISSYVITALYAINFRPHATPPIIVVPTRDETASRVTSFHIRGPSEIENL